MASSLLGIDIGTSGVKAGLFRADGRLVALAHVPCRHDSPRPGWAETPPERWWRALMEVLKKLADERPGCLGEVGAVGFSALYPALCALDGAGRPLRSAILYCDQRSTEQVKNIARKTSLAGIEKQIGNRVVPGTCSVTSILWIRDHEPGIYRRTKVFCHANSYIGFKLTGRVAMDRTNVSLTGLAAMGREGCFSASLAQRYGVDLDKLPPVVESTEVIGRITAKAARQTGLKQGTPVVMGAGDAVSAAFGAGLAGVGNIFYAAGTTDCAVLATATPPKDARFANGAYCTPKLWVSIGTMTSTGAAVEWFARAFLGAGKTAADVERLAASASAGSSGLLFLPYLQGERTPVWDPEARGVLLGLSLNTSLANGARAILEGAALGLREVVETLESSYNIRGKAKIIAAGGCTRNKLWMKIKASALGRPIRVLKFQESSALGAAIMAGLGTGIYRTPQAALSATAGMRSFQTIHPLASWQKIYEQYYPIYRRLYGRLRGELRELSCVERRFALKKMNV